VIVSVCVHACMCVRVFVCVNEDDKHMIVSFCWPQSLKCSFSFLPKSTGYAAAGKSEVCCFLSTGR